KKTEADKPDKGSGQVTLRLGEALKQEVIGLGKRLGLDLNGLIGVMIRRSLSHFHMEARLLAMESEEGLGDLQAWKTSNPGRAPREFLDDYVRRQYGRW